MKSKIAAERFVNLINERISHKPFWYACVNSQMKPSFIKAMILYAGNKMSLDINHDILAKSCSGDYNKAVIMLADWYKIILQIEKDWSESLSEDAIERLKELDVWDK